MMGSVDDWTEKDWVDWLDEANGAHRASLVRAAQELEKVAEAIEALPERMQRRLSRASAPDYTLAPEIIRGEAERARDTLAVYTLRRE